MSLKKVGLLSLVGSLLLILASCRIISPFNGSRTGNDEQLIIWYDVLNEEDSQELNLKKSDKILGDVDNKLGKITVKILDENKNELLKKNYKKESDNFTYKIPKDGKYIVSVRGKRAKGKVSLVKEGSVIYENGKFQKKKPTSSIF